VLAAFLQALGRQAALRADIEWLPQSRTTGHVDGLIRPIIDFRSAPATS
jgi:hypothetical protein